MVKKIDKDEFIARLDGTLEEKIYEAYYYGFKNGFNQFLKGGFKAEFRDIDNWMANVSYQDWIDSIEHPEIEEEVEK